LSGLGAATSFAGPVAALAPLGIQMATDAMGLTGDKSKKGPSAKTAPAGPPSLKAKQDYAASKGKYYSSSDQKTYKNYNDALAAKNSRRGTPGVSPGKPPAAPVLPPPSGSGGSSTPASQAKPTGTPAKPTGTPAKPTGTPMQQWAAKHKDLAAKVKTGQSGYDEISATRTKPGPNEKQDQTPTTGPTPTADQQKQLNQTGYSPLTSDQESEAKKRNKAQAEAEKQTAAAIKESYDAFDLVLEYLTSEGHVESLNEALYVMMEMDSETIQGICEAAKDQSDKQIERGVKTTYKAGNVLDNTHQGRSPGLNKLPRGEREKKTKRMRKRLEARRSDLFGERGNREDEKREKLKKLLGL
jgi:hypothetical protein